MTHQREGDVVSDRSPEVGVAPLPECDIVSMVRQHNRYRRRQQRDDAGQIALRVIGPGLGRVYATWVGSSGLLCAHKDDARR